MSKLITIIWQGSYDELRKIYLAHIDPNAKLDDSVESKGQMICGIDLHLRLNGKIKPKINITEDGNDDFKSIT